MDADNIEEFIPTFAHLFLEVILNEQSKQVYEEFISILVLMLTNHKKVVLK
jgi:hypothetical protein